MIRRAISKLLGLKPVPDLTVHRSAGSKILTREEAKKVLQAHRGHLISRFSDHKRARDLMLDHIRKNYVAGEYQVSIKKVVRPERVEFSMQIESSRSHLYPDQEKFIQRMDFKLERLR